MSIADDLTRLVKPPPAAPRLKTAAQPVAIRAQTGLEKMARARGDIQTEEVTAISTDGIFTFVVRVALA